MVRVASIWRCTVICTLYSKSAWWRQYLLGREEEECVTAKNLKQAESSTCTKNGTHLCISSQFHDLQLHNAMLPSCFNKMCERSKLTWQVLAKQEHAVVGPYWCEELLLQCYPCLTVKEGHVASQSNSWASLLVKCGPYLISFQLSCSASTFSHAFTRTLQLDWMCYF